ncbi:MAG TPA: NrfA- nitrite reduction protein [Polyangia bacterium]|nr:NrfA- nitrite reduction protein [Polyangia bacterium]
MHGTVKIVLGLAALGAAGAVFFKRAEQSSFLPGPTSDGHHQIEKKCDACHTPFGGVAQAACLACHADGMESEQDSHSPGKFEDPRNALALGRIDAGHCVECHREHRPTQTDRMSVSARAGFCVECHRDVGKDRVSHQGLAFTTCNDSGCHNFHDNRSVYTEFLAKHRGEPDLLRSPAVPSRAAQQAAVLTASAPAAAFEPNPTLDEGAAKSAPPIAADVPPGIDEESVGRQAIAAATSAWQSSAHARQGINCSGCHRAAGDDSGAWNWRPEQTVACAGCHSDEKRTFLGGKHGMRLAVGLPPMRPADARLPMKDEVARDAHESGLTCSRCHDAHAPDLRVAAVERCEGCHNDGHTRAYRQSAHFTAWQAEVAGTKPPGSGVSCATCHLPRAIDRFGVTPRVWADHNQNGNLRPVDKMARSVCMSCHGLQFSLNALADRAVVAGNFAAAPSPVRTGFDFLPRSAK